MPRCPVCSAAVDLATSSTPPFCSDRCRLVDLGRWLDESYAVPEVRRATDDDEGSEVEAAPPPEPDPDE